MKPKINKTGFAAAGTSNPWAIPWNKPKVATKININLVGILFWILIPNPKRITENTIPISTK